MDVSPTRIALVQLVDYVEATFRPLTAEKGLDFSVRVSPELPATLHTDEQRLLQVLRNLLSNAVKFTDTGAVELVIRPAKADVPASIREQLLEAGSLSDPDADLIAFSVTDTGIGIAASKMRVIFEAFKQADGTTSRKYGGTGLGLSISREIARLLGGEIHAQSEPGRARPSRCTCRCTPTSCRRTGTGRGRTPRRSRCSAGPRRRVLPRPAAEAAGPRADRAGCGGTGNGARAAGPAPGRAARGRRVGRRAGAAPAPDGGHGAAAALAARAGRAGSRPERRPGDRDGRPGGAGAEAQLPVRR